MQIVLFLEIVDQELVEAGVGVQVHEKILVLFNLQKTFMKKSIYVSLNIFESTFSLKPLYVRGAF